MSGLGWRRDDAKHCSCRMLPLAWDNIPAPHPALCSAPSAPSGMMEKKPQTPLGRSCCPPLLLPGMNRIPQHPNLMAKRFFLPHLHQSVSHHSRKVDIKLIFCGQRAEKPQPAEPESHSAAVWETPSALSTERTITKHKNCIFSPPEPNPSSKCS